MEKTIIQAPSAKLEITDANGVRQIHVNGLATYEGSKQKVQSDISTHLSIGTIQELVNQKGDWWLDEMERRTKKDYVAKRFLSLIQRFGGLKNTKILDIGSGCGSSAMIMIDAGAASVTGVEPVANFVQLAKHRIMDEGLENQINFIHLEDTSKLPFVDQSFDIITFSAVIEHIHPKIRTSILRDAYRCLKPNGRLVITETPNRAFPYDGHTTHLPILPWLPLILSAKIAKYFSCNSPRGLSKDEYIEEGLIGGNYWQIKKALSGANCLNLNSGDAEWKCGLKNSSHLLCTLLNIAESILKIFSLPLAAFMPVLDLVFQKPAKI
ncbi:MAG: class I SAM-dependent methyltransferase [Patescibacteria group bacterium]